MQGKALAAAADTTQVHTAAAAAAGPTSGVLPRGHGIQQLGEAAGAGIRACPQLGQGLNEGGRAGRGGVEEKGMRRATNPCPCNCKHPVAALPPQGQHTHCSPHAPVALGATPWASTSAELLPALYPTCKIIYIFPLPPPPPPFYHPTYSRRVDDALGIKQRDEPTLQANHSFPIPP